MSSATHPDMSQVAALVAVVPDLDGGTQPCELSPRQKKLDAYWRYYRCEAYRDRGIDWNGYPVLGAEDSAMVAQSGAMPPGFYDAGATLPLKFRKPSTPYYLARAVVAKFNGLLFSEKRHPKIVCDDPQTEAWLNAFIEVTQFWAQAILMRTYGGGMGSVAMGFKFVNGKPYVEVYDTRWCTPEWADRTDLTLRSLDKRFQFSLMVTVNRRNPTNGQITQDKETRWFWYRRHITETSDTVWAKVPVPEDPEEEPEWDKYPSQTVEHGLGFCPIVWIQNEPDDSPDGDPDCYGAFELIESIDALLSQASRGTIASCDPTLGISADAEFDEIKKGSNNAIQVEKGGTVTYLEITGTGIDRAQKLADDLEKRALVIVQCMLDPYKENGPARSTVEVEHQYSAMTERADVFRRQYGDRGVKILLNMVLRAARSMGETRAAEDASGVTRIFRQTVKLPRAKKTAEDGSWEYVDREIGRGETITLKWPGYYTPTIQSIAHAVTAVGEALRTYKVIAIKDAVEFLAPYLDIDDVGATVLELEEEEEMESLAGGGLDKTLAKLMAPASRGKSEKPE